MIVTAHSYVYKHDLKYGRLETVIHKTVLNNIVLVTLRIIEGP